MIRRRDFITLLGGARVASEANAAHLLAAEEPC